MGPRAEKRSLVLARSDSQLGSVKIPVIAALVTFGLVACESSTPIASTQSPAATAATMTIEIISDPPGAPIEVNYHYVGQAPISITVPTRNGSFAKGAMIRALPTLQGNYIQEKFFDPGMSVPSRILFSMGSGPASR
jgi:hypothetical protein